LKALREEASEEDSMRYRDTLGRLFGAAIVWSAILTASVDAHEQSSPGPPSKTQVVLLGTGNPFPDPDRSGPATAIVVNGSAYLVDFGPGVVRRAKAAMFDKGITALEPTNLTVAFVTHLHSDHTVGYPDLIFTPWVMGRKVPLEVYGPKGIKAMTDHILAAWQADMRNVSPRKHGNLAIIAIRTKLTFMRSVRE
jgi:ribonuclease BN (tRNA processing enzyme)